MTEERPEAGGERTPSEPTPSWPRRAARAAADAAWQDLSGTGRHWADRGKGYVRGAWSRRPPRGAMTARLFLVAVAAVAAASVLAQAGLSARLPSPLDWRAAAALLERDARPGDAVLVAPAWAERARAELPARVPVFSFARYDREPLLGVRRAWVLSLDGAPFGRGRVAVDVAARASATGGAQRVGAFAVTRYDLADPARALAFLPDRMADAQGRSGKRPCDREGPLALRCDGGATRIAREVREVAGDARPCVTAPAGASGESIAVTFPDVPMGLALRGGAGVVGRSAPAVRAPIRVALELDGQELGALELPPGPPAWSHFELRTPQVAGEAHALTVVLSSPEPGDRTVCFDAWTTP